MEIEIAAALIACDQILDGILSKSLPHSKRIDSTPMTGVRTVTGEESSRAPIGLVNEAKLKIVNKYWPELIPIQEESTIAGLEPSNAVGLAAAMMQLSVDSAVTEKFGNSCDAIFTPRVPTLLIVV